MPDITVFNDSAFIPFHKQPGTDKNERGKENTKWSGGNGYVFSIKATVTNLILPVGLYLWKWK